MSSGSVSHTEWHHHVLCVCVFTCDPVMTEGGKLEGRVHLYKCFCAAGLGRSSSGCQRQHLDSSKRHGRYLQHTHTHTHTEYMCCSWSCDRAVSEPTGEKRVMSRISPCHSKLPGEPTMTSVWVMEAEIPMLHMTSLLTSPRWLNTETQVHW